jgi:hypothetical protein
MTQWALWSSLFAGYQVMTTRVGNFASHRLLSGVALPDANANQSVSVKIQRPWTLPRSQTTRNFSVPSIYACGIPPVSPSGFLAASRTVAKSSECNYWQRIKDGLALEQKTGLIPLRMDFIGSTDTHSATQGAIGDVFGRCCLDPAEEAFYSAIIQERAWTSSIWINPEP